MNRYSCNQQPYFNVSWFGPVANNGTRHATTATPNFHTAVGDPCVQNTNIMATDMWTNVTEVGPNVTQHGNEYTNLWAHYGQEGIKNLECLYNWFETYQPGAFNQEKFLQRRLSRSYASTYYRDYFLNGQGSALMMDFTNGRVYMGPRDNRRVDVGSFDQFLNQSGCKTQ